MNASFNREWNTKIRRVRACKCWKQITSPPAGSFEVSTAATASNEVRIDDTWSLAVNAEFPPHGPAQAGIDDLKSILKSNFGIRLKSARTSANQPCIEFCIKPGKRAASRWENAFRLDIGRDKAVV